MVLAIPDIRPGVLVDRGAGPGDRGDRRLETFAHAGVDLGECRGRPHRYTELAEPAAARRRQFEPPRRLLQDVRAGKDVQSQSDILGMARHRADHRDIGRRDSRRGSMAARRDDTPARLMAVNAAVMSRIAQ